MIDLKKKVILITGGSGFFGSRLAKIISTNNGIPVIIDNKFSKNKSFKYDFFKTDITKLNEVKTTIKKVIKKYKKIDCLINNAALNTSIDKNKQKLENFSIKKWNEEINVGLTGALIVTQAVVKAMIKNKSGSIINISSDLGLIAPNQSIYNSNTKKPVSYSVVKHGIIGFGKYLATYLADHNIRSNILCPGGIYNNQPKKFVKKLEKLIPLKRMAKINDYDGIILYLCSDYSEYMTGSVITCDGGRTAW
jgi:NAD(P)-dependent dehydrogenase (short-subunit alcohol dehydrogenase family)